MSYISTYMNNKMHFLSMSSNILVIFPKTKSSLNPETTMMKFSPTSTSVNSYNRLDLILTNQHLMLMKGCRLNALSLHFKKEKHRSLRTLYLA